jgi:hypothetical protein
MPRTLAPAFVVLTTLVAAPPAWAQSTTGSIQGVVTDEQKAVVSGATVTIRNVDTNAIRSVVTTADGRFRAPSLPIGNYEVTVEIQSFARYVRSGVTLSLNQDAVIDVTLKAAELQETVTVVADASLLNTTNAEVGVSFDNKRVAELPISPDRSIFGLALSAPGVSQLGSGQVGYAVSGATTGATSLNFSANGMRTRSNNFMIDGLDINDPLNSGVGQSINNPDVVQEVRLITNQYAAEYGRIRLRDERGDQERLERLPRLGLLVREPLRDGGRGHGGHLHERAHQPGQGCRTRRWAGPRPLPARAPGRRHLRRAIVKDKTFFFASYQRWTNSELASGLTLNGAPTTEGRSILQSVAGSEPQVQALLDFLPAAQTPTGRSSTFTRNGVTYTIPLGSLTAEATQEFKNHQGSFRVDHSFSSKHLLSARFLIGKTEQSRAGGHAARPGSSSTRQAAIARRMADQHPVAELGERVPRRPPALQH